MSSDCGTNWRACEGLTVGLPVVADTVNPARFYAFDSETGRILVSTNGAASFAPMHSRIPGWVEGETIDTVLRATPEREGNLWCAVRNRGLYHSTDSGATFAQVKGVEDANSIGFGKAAPGATEPTVFLTGRISRVQGIYRSDDFGKTWVRINDDQHQYGWVNHVTGDPRIFGRVYFATGGRGIIYGDPAKLLNQ